jgi:putative acetyltransferase
MTNTDMHVRRARAEDRARLLDVWERSVRATHVFLTEADIVALRPLVAEELASDVINWRVLASAAGTLVGFLGYTSNTIERLFIDPESRGQGGGKRLVAHAETLASGPLAVDVNEQNEAALGFYAALGFAIVRRSPTDSAGRPFPLLHLERSRQVQR